MKATSIVILAFSIGVLSLTANASTIACNPCLGGFEDTPNTPVEKLGDFNDLTFTVAGGDLIQSGGVFTALTPALALSNNHSPFWNNVSLDCPQCNIGDFWEGVGGYSGGPVVSGGIEYLATSSGGIVSDVEFSGGATVTITGGITSDDDSLEVCLVSNCAATTRVVNGSLTWTPTQDWEVIGVVNGSAKYYSDASWGQSSSFAFAVDPVGTPEPGSILLMGVGLLVVGLVKRRFYE